MRLRLRGSRRLTSATNPQHTATYAYDPFSRRASKTVDGVPTVFVDDGSRTLAEYNNGGSEIQHYVYGADSTPIASEQFNGQPTALGIHYFYTDALGSITFLAVAAG